MQFIVNVSPLYVTLKVSVVLHDGLDYCSCLFRFHPEIGKFLLVGLYCVSWRKPTVLVPPKFCQGDCDTTCKSISVYPHRHMASCDRTKI